MNATHRLDKILGSIFVGLAVAAWTGCTTYQEQAQGGSYAEIRTASDFYEPLSPYGRWEVVGSYGRCWIPGGVDADWSPYSNGYWEQSDAGWYWASDEPWGWATYHYGRWDMSPQFGWFWVPQTQWAPAWVSWREGGGYVGWAPLGPSGRGVEVANRRGGAPGGYVFVEERRFLDPVRPTRFNANNSVIEKTVINQGPGAVAIERSSGRKFQAMPARDLRGRDEARVLAKHPAPTPAHENAVPAPGHRLPDRPLPTPQPHQVERPALTTPSPPPAARNDSHPAGAQTRTAKPNAETHPPQGPARAKDNEQRLPSPPSAETRREPPPAARPEIKPEAPQAAKPEGRPEVSHAVKPVPKPVQHEPQPKAKAESKPAPEQPAATREPTEHKPGKDPEKNDQ